jgi:DNA topoisomerase IA
VTMDLIILESPNKVKEVERYAKACGFDARALATVGHHVRRNLDRHPDIHVLGPAAS